MAAYATALVYLLLLLASVGVSPMALLPWGFVAALFTVLKWAFNVLVWVTIASAILSWMGPASPMGAVLNTLVDPLLRPIAPDHARQWLTPQAPARLYGGTYLVGFGGLSVALIDTVDGLILIDGALPQAEPAILAKIRKLGFDPRRIRYILSTEPHFDHAGGLAALARDTGATVVASVRGAEGLRSGRLASLVRYLLSGHHARSLPTGRQACLHAPLEITPSHPLCILFCGGICERR